MVPPPEELEELELELLEELELLLELEEELDELELLELGGGAIADLSRIIASAFLKLIEVTAAPTEPSKWSGYQLLFAVLVFTGNGTLIAVASSYSK
jgi:glycerol dehydrogenase-like iron-containing ADH family enzyme